ncbi:MAG: DUF484 family protein [Gammaproteobacteria bacterium]
MSDAGMHETHVAQYLRDHPDFFNRHPELLGSLFIPHESGQAVSLWERQVAVLREENERLKGRFDAFLVSARENEALISRIHRLALALMEAVGPEAIFQLLTRRLAEDFGATRATVLLFATPAYVEGQLPQFVGADSPRRVPFADTLRERTPLCGQLSLIQTQALFDGEPFRGSHVVMPLAGSQWDGVLAISSDDPSRFDAQMGTEFVAFLRDVAVLAIAPWIARPRRAR